MSSVLLTLGALPGGMTGSTTRTLPSSSITSRQFCKRLDCQIVAPVHQDSLQHVHVTIGGNAPEHVACDDLAAAGERFRESNAFDDQGKIEQHAGQRWRA